jgi:hypothetical protein
MVASAICKPLFCKSLSFALKAFRADGMREKGARRYECGGLITEMPRRAIFSMEIWAKRPLDEKSGAALRS